MVMAVRTWSRLARAPHVYFNGGGQFIAGGVPYPGASVLTALRRETLATETGASPPGEPYVWELRSDLVDLDGNGIPEAVSFDGSTFTRIKEAASVPPRLMTEINNGRGATTTISYAHMHDPTVVVQAPGTMWPDAPRPKATPITQWVVRSLRTIDAFAGTDATTTQRYTHPRHGANDDGRYAFRGFAEVTTTGPSGARTIQRYGYDVDKTGRLIETVVKPAPAEGPTDARSISRTTWEARSLFDGLVVTHHAITSEQLTCANGQTDPADGLANPCTPTTAAAYTKTTSMLKDYHSHLTGGGPALLWQEIGTLTEALPAPAHGHRSTSTDHYVYANATTYRVRAIETERHHGAPGAMVRFAKSAQTWDPSYRVPVTSETWVDDVDAHRAIASAEYDLQTGNLLRRWKPVQHAASGPSTNLTYDARKLFVASEDNELGTSSTTSTSTGPGRGPGPTARTSGAVRPGLAAPSMPCIRSTSSR